MFKEKLMTALNDAINNFNGGTDENGSVVKAASDHGFNPEQTQRLVEAFNTTKTICFYKHADDRSAVFPTADPDAVIVQLFGEKDESAKTASDDSYVDYDYYENDHPELKKYAGLKADFDPWSGFGSNDEFRDEEAEARVKVAEYQGLIDAANACDNAALIAATHYDLTIEKVANEIGRRLYHESGLADELYTYGKSLNKMAEEAVDAILDRLPIDKSALKDLRISAFDHRDPMLASSIKSAAEALQQSGVMAANKIQVEKMAAELNQELGIHKEDPPDELEDFIPKRAAGSLVGDAMGTLASTAGKEVSKGLVDTTKASLDRDAKSTQRKFTDRAKNMYRTLMLQRLMTTDPILKGADENAVARAYESLVELAPEVSLKEDVTRSILREAVTTTAMSPYDAKSFVDLDAAIKKQLTAAKPSKEEDKK